MQFKGYMVWVALIGGLSGCMEAPAFMEKSKGEDASSEVTRSESSFTQPAGDHSSEVIDTLLARSSMLKSGSAYDRVAHAALDASSRAAESELRSAKLRAEAKSKNWLPTIGPNVSLSSLGELVAGISAGTSPV